ncbi:hypothetical protein FE257_011619 [Aspergillus nanangensis]|uniref:Uncharacterized protein n=1 Tax=Aspergillus nanangensis TaxID=2582783 RepID=A0AAD4CV96_ASPNN|nr:hypothetical protein FE257_011619 [Aspergillus nanangensis]
MPFKDIYVQIPCILPWSNTVEMYERALVDLNMGMFSVWPGPHPGGDGAPGFELCLTVPDTPDDDSDIHFYRNLATTQIKEMLNQELMKMEAECRRLLLICKRHGRDIQADVEVFEEFVI